MSIPYVLDCYPPNGASGIAIGGQIKVYFDQEMDETSINTGTFVVSGPDNGIFFGDEFNLVDQPGLKDEDILSSPYYSGFVKGVVSFARVDENGDPVDEDTKDYTGAGNLWRTVAIFTSLAQLNINNTYTVILSGDENLTDGYDSGAKTRTVFDPYSLSVSGTGELFATGGYTETSANKYHIVITSAGITGDAEYEWYRDYDPLTVFSGITTTGERELENGVIIMFGPDGEYQVGDHWTIVCKPGIQLPNNYKWSFSTGSGSIITPSSSYPASGIHDLVSIGSGELKITKITPKDGATNLSPDSVNTFEIEFNKELDATTCTASTITLWTEPVNGNPSIQSSGILAKIISVSGNKITVQF
jgi:hypothetical protein